MAAAKVTILKSLLSFIILVNFGYYSTEAKMLAMRPLSARQVYRLLHESGRSDAIPQGRVITQGLAAMTGFALGLTKGLGGALLFDIITANVTAADLEAAVNGGSGSSSALTTQEICFNSRNARSLAEAQAVAEAYSRDGNKSKKDRPKVRLSEVERHVTRKRRDKRRKKSSKRRHKRPSRLELAKQNPVTTTGGQAAATVTATGTNAPGITATTVTSPTNAGTGTDTNVDNGDGTGTSSTSTTSTGNGGAVNCVVIQKPALG